MTIKPVLANLGGVQKLFWPTVGCIAALLLCLGLQMATGVPEWAIAAIIFYLYFCYRTLKIAPIFCIVCLNYLFIRLTEIASGAIIEGGQSLAETSLTGESVGSTIRLGIYYILFVFAAAKCFYFLNKKWSVTFNPRPAGAGFVLIALTAGVLVSLIGAYAGLKDGFAFLLGLNRFSQRSAIDSFYLDLFLNNRLVAILLLSVVSTAGRKRIIRYGATILIGVIVALSVLHGDQFATTIALLLTAAIYPLLGMYLKGREVTKLVLPYVGVTAIIGAAVVLAIYSRQGYDVLGMATARFALQGQLWYAVDISQADIWQSNLSSFARNVRSFFFWDATSLLDYAPPLGMRELMYLHATPSVYDTYLENNVTFTMGQMAMLLYWFGYLGMVIPIIFTGFVFSATLVYLWKSLARRKILGVILAAKLFTWVTFALQQGEYWYMFGVKTILFCLLIVVYELASRPRRLPRVRLGVSGAD